MSTASLRARYLGDTVTTASPQRLLVMLYDGCLRFLRRAHAAAENGARPQCTQAVSRATAISDRWELSSGATTTPRCESVRQRSMPE